MNIYLEAAPKKCIFLAKIDITLMSALMSTKNETKEIKKSAETNKGTSSLPGAMPSIWYT